MALGNQSLYTNLSGFNNIALGVGALFENSDGSSNVGIGYSSLYDNVSGISNTAIGILSLADTTASYNTGCGELALGRNTSGQYNSALGSGAGSYQKDGSSGLTTPENSVYIGADTKSGSDPAGGEDAIDNEIVIGYNAIGNGSDTVTIGNDDITDNYFSGSVNVATSTTAGKEALTLDQNDEDQPFIKFDGALPSPDDASKNVTTWTTGAVLQGFVRVNVMGIDYWMPVYSAPTSA